MTLQPAAPFNNRAVRVRSMTVMTGMCYMPDASGHITVKCYKLSVFLLRDSNESRISPRGSPDIVHPLEDSPEVGECPQQLRPFPRKEPPYFLCSLFNPFHI